MSGLVVEVPISYSAEVAAMGLFWLLVEVLEDEGHVVPVLHEKGVGVVDNDDFDGGKEVVVCFLGAVPS